MRGAEGIIFAFRPFREAGEAAALAQGPDPVPASGNDLVRIALMADIPDQPVFWCVEDIMDGSRQLDHAQAGTQMSAGCGYGIDHFGTQLVRKLAELSGL